jgi:hypothetical protein
MYGRILVFVLLLFSFGSAIPVNLSIDVSGGAQFVDTEAVVLSLLADNTTASTNCSNSNDGVSWAAYEPYSTTKNWNLTSGDGLKSVFFRCTDDGANYSDVASDQITLDQTNPSIGSLAPGNGSIVTSLRPTISVTMTDSGSGIDENLTVFKLDGSAINGTYDSGTGLLNYSPSSDLSETSHIVEVEAYDRLGHSSIVSWNFTIDQLPVIANLAPENNTFTKSETFTISAEISDSGSGIKQSTTNMKIDGSDVDISFVSNRVEHSADLSEGNHTIVLNVYDNIGNLATKTWYVVVDSTEPTISSLNPADLSTVSAVTVVSARITDSVSGIKESTLKMKINNVDVTDSTSFTGGVLTFQIGSMNAGQHTAEIWVDDKAGNSGFKHWTFTIEKMAPTIGSLTPGSGATVNELRPTISARITDPGTSGLNLNTLKMTLDGSDVASQTNYDALSSVISYNPLTDMSQGTHRIKVSISNNVGDLANKEWEFTINTSGPSSPTNLKISKLGSKATLSWSAVSGASKYNIYRSTSMIQTISGLNLYKSVTTTSYSDTVGSDKFYYGVAAVDSSGNEGAAAFIGTCADYDNGWIDYQCCSDSDCGMNKCNLTSHKCYYPGSTTPPVITKPPSTPNTTTNDSDDTNTTDNGTGKKKPLPCLGGFVVLGSLFSVFGFLILRKEL